MAKKNNDIQTVSLHDVKTDNDYIEWLKEIKSRYRSSQIKAAVKVNSEKLFFNWRLGRDLVMRKAEERWGTGIVEQVALDLQREFPNNGFSVTNVWYMKQWYLFYSVGSQKNKKLQQVVGELKMLDNQNIEKLHQVGAEIIDDDAEGNLRRELNCLNPNSKRNNKMVCSKQNFCL